MASPTRKTVAKKAAKKKKLPICTPKQRKLRAKGKKVACAMPAPKKPEITKPTAAASKPPAVKQPSFSASPGPAAPLGAAPVLAVPSGLPTGAPAPSVAQPVPAPAPPSLPIPDPSPSVGPLPQPGGFGPVEAERLLWRAGFGPGPGDVDRLVALGLDGAVAWLLEGDGTPAPLVGPAPHDENGGPIMPRDLWGHDHVWWLDRMVRTTRPLQERMTLVWHDWFATSRDKVFQADVMLAQNATLRANALGRFDDLLLGMVQDPAMHIWLDRLWSTRWAPNENFSRELMELFTLGAGRGAYTEQDVRELARAFTGWLGDWTPELGIHNFRIYEPYRDTGTKTAFGKTGAWDEQDAARLCLDHDLHPSFFVTKLWSAFVPTPPSPATQAALQAAYVGSGRHVKPVLEIILKHPDLLHGEAMVKPPVVQVAGLLKALGRGVDTAAWWWLGAASGQQLFFPPDVAGWDESRWLDTSTWRWRFNTVAAALDPKLHDVWNVPYPVDETPAQAVDKALALLGNPVVGQDARDELLAYAKAALPPVLASWQAGPYRAMRFNALCFLIASSPYALTS